MLCLGVKPYACTMCDMRFIQRYQLERHSLTHTGTSSFFFFFPWSSLSLTSLVHVLHINIYMAASNSSLYCFLSLYWQVLMFNVASARSFISTCITILPPKLCIWDDMMTMRHKCQHHSFQFNSAVLFETVKFWMLDVFLMFRCFILQCFIFRLFFFQSAQL